MTQKNHTTDTHSAIYQEELKDLMDFSSQHVNYHYQESCEFYYIGCALIMLQKYEDAIDAFDKSIMHWADNQDSIKTREFCDSILDIGQNKTEFSFYLKLPSYIYGKNNDFQNLQQTLDISYTGQNYLSFFHDLKTLNTMTSSLHFDYHITLANKYYNIATIQENTGNYHEARYYLNKAIETDKRNKNNTLYKEKLNNIKKYL